MKKKIEMAAHSHTDLTVFAAIVAILEGGCVYTDSGIRTAARIIKLCKAEQAKQLRVYDFTVLLAGTEKGSTPA